MMCLTVDFFGFILFEIQLLIYVNVCLSLILGGGGSDIISSNTISVPSNFSSNSINVNIGFFVIVPLNREALVCLTFCLFLLFFFSLFSFCLSD